jgi:pimeloyl-ACP methyl ester carboxylesterase
MQLKWDGGGNKNDEFIGAGWRSAPAGYMNVRRLLIGEFMTPSWNIDLSIIIICLIVATGCTGNASPAQPAVQANPYSTAVSYNTTPVQFAQVNGVTLGYREFGSGEPVLMVQGFGAAMNNWNETFIGILASKYHVYIYDHRGMGNSSDSNATPTISLYADDAAGLMTALGHDSMHVYGVSMGSSISQQLAIDHPERVRKLILDSNAYSVRIPETKKLLGNIEAVAASPAMPEGVRREAQANLAWNGSWDGLSGIHKDVMLVVGTSDDLTPDAVSVRMAGQINGSWLVRFKGLPHVGSHYAPVEYGENALTFLSMDESPLSK